MVQVTPTRPFKSVKETGITALIAKDEAEVSISGDYSATADLTVSEGGQAVSGYIRSMLLVVAKTGTGAIQSGGAGFVYFFDADPNTTSGDTALAAAGAEHKTILGVVAIAATDWDEDTVGGVVYKNKLDIPFHALSTIYAVFRNTDGTVVFNSGATDDETMDINVWYDTETNG